MLLSSHQQLITHKHRAALWHTALWEPGWGDTTCPGLITGADGNTLPHALSSGLSLIGQRLPVTL